MKMNRSVIRIIGLAATLIGMAATSVTDWVDEQKMNEKIDERVNEALAQTADKRES